MIMIQGQHINIVEGGYMRFPRHVGSTFLTAIGRKVAVQDVLSGVGVGR